MFSDDEDERVTHLAEVEKICEIYSYADLQDLNNRLQENSTAKQVNVHILYIIWKEIFFSRIFVSVLLNKS